jgi:hypothetical protein
MSARCRCPGSRTTASRVRRRRPGPRAADAQVRSRRLGPTMLPWSTQSLPPPRSHTPLTSRKKVCSAGSGHCRAHARPRKRLWPPAAGVKGRILQQRGLPHRIVPHPGVHLGCSHDDGRQQRGLSSSCAAWRAGWSHDGKLLLLQPCRKAG